jgi:hypothetical protein
MKSYHRSERGQALVLIVAGIIGLVGITALSIDGGNAYFDRRRAQNAADTAAMAAGLAKVRQPLTNTGFDWKAPGYERAVTNGYLQSGPTTSVEVLRCDEAGANCALPPLAPSDSLENYLTVKITSVVSTYFGPVVGIHQLTNRVEAVAKAVPPKPTPWYNGAALASLMPHCKPNGWPDDPFTVTGGASVIIQGISNVFVNSDCERYAYTQDGTSSLTSQSGTCVVGGSSYNTWSGTSGTNPPPNGDCTQVDLQMYVLPNPDCDIMSPGSITKVGNDYIATPGRYEDTFPEKVPGVNGSGTLKLQKGLYCLKQGLELHSNWDMTTDINPEDGQYNDSEGVMFFVPGGNVLFNGGSHVNIHAITCHYCGLDEGLVGYLVYLPPTNPSSVTLTGGSGSVFAGTILAPASPITLSGGSAGDSVNLQCQILGYTIKATGSGILNITYDQSKNATTWTNPLLQPFK